MNNRFKKEQDCYLDTKTGLEWSLDNINPLPWDEAVKACESLGKGWRLPSIEELLTLVNYDRYSPATELPKILSSYYWSSTTNAYNADSAWYVYFHPGLDGHYYKSVSYYVRAVREG